VEPRLLGAFRARAIVSGVVAGALALIGLTVLHADTPHLFGGLDQGAGLGAVAVSAAAGVITIALVWFGRYEPARYAGAAAVAAIIAGWAAAQQPDILPGLSHPGGFGRSGNNGHGSSWSSASAPSCWSHRCSSCSACFSKARSIPRRSGKASLRDASAAVSLCPLSESWSCCWLSDPC